MGIMYITAPIFLVFAIFDCHDSWWQTMMGLQLFPPGVEAWNRVANKGIVAYGDVIENEVEYKDFYNMRGEE